VNDDFIANLQTVLREIRKVRRELGQDVPEPPSIEAVRLAHDEAGTTLWGWPEHLVEGMPE
jgi:hypothetical protein